MDTLKLKVNYRKDLSKGRMKQIRRQGYATGSISGRDVKSVSVEVKLLDLINQMKHSTTGMKSLFDLDIVDAPAGSSGLVIIKDYYTDPITRKLMDIQFQRVSMVEKIHVGVPIELVGEATACLREGGRIEQTLEELQILCLPSDIPTKIQVDVSGVEIGTHIRVSDVVVADGVEILSDPDATIVVSNAPTVRRTTEEESE